MEKILTAVMTIIATLALALALILLIGGVVLIITNPTNVAVIPGILVVMFGAYGVVDIAHSIKTEIA